MQASFVILLEGGEHAVVRRIQTDIAREFDAYAALYLEPHITVKYAFEVTDLGAVEEYFNTFCQKIQSFDITVHNVGYFGEEVVFLDVAKNERLTALHLGILADTASRFKVEPAEYEGENLHFHITLAYEDISKETFRSIRQYLGKQDIRMNFPIRTLGMYLKIDEKSPWFVYRTGTV